MEKKRLSTVRGIVGYTGSVVGGAAIGFIAMPIATRLFSPTELGRVGLFNSYLQAIQLLAIAGLDQAYMRYRGGVDAAGSTGGLLRKCFYLSFGLLVIIGLAIAYVDSDVSRAILGAERRWLVPALLLAAAGSVLYRYATIEMRVAGRVGAFAVATIGFAFLSRVLFLGSAFTAGIGSAEVLMLSLGYASAGILSLVLIWSVLCEPRSLAPIALSRLVRFSTPFVISSAFALVSTSITPIYIARVGGPEDVGLFNTAVSLASVLTVVETGVLSYWTPRVYASYKDNSTGIRSLQEGLALAMLLAGMILILSRDLIFLVVGSEFRVAVRYFGVLLAVPVLTFVGELGGIGLLLAKRSSLYSFSYVVGASLTLLVVLSTVPSVGLAGGTVGLASGAGLTMTLRIVLARRVYQPFTSETRVLFGVALFLICAVVVALPWPEDLSWLCNVLVLVALGGGLWLCREQLWRWVRLRSRK